MDRIAEEYYCDILCYKAKMYLEECRKIEGGLK